MYMVNTNWWFLETEDWVDWIVKELNLQLEAMFPEMNEWVKKNNWIFTRLLNDYITWDITWVPEFLENKWYEYKWKMLVGDKNVSLKSEAKEKVLNWEYYVWLKRFFEIKRNQMEEKNYLIFAKKKDKHWFEWLKDYFRDFIAWFMSSKWQN